MLVRTDDSVGRVLAISGVWEPNVTAAFNRLLSPGDVCVDVGGHIGYYTLLASRLVGLVATFCIRALACELPRALVQPRAQPRCERDRASGGRRRNRNARRAARGPGTNTGGATLSPLLAARRGGQPAVEVEVRPLADNIPEADWARIRVVKVDVEGYEVDVLEGLVPILERATRLAVFVELSPKWLPEIPGYVEGFCRRQGFNAKRLRTGYTLDALFPSELSEPEEVDAIPTEHCDLLLTR